MEWICDLHGHFLPGMDDGCKTPQESLQVLQSSYAKGVRRMFATPHYYPGEPVERFLERRAESVRLLEEYIRQQGVTELPRICLGAEVAYRPGISNEEQLSKLCLGNSRYLLLEMPFRRWGRAEEREVRKIGVTAGVTPVLAHIERYFDYQEQSVLQAILEQDVLVQMNAEYVVGMATRAKARKLLRSGVVHLLGSDCHNTQDRPPNLGDALKILEKRRMLPALSRVAQFSDEIFTEATEE